MGYDDVTAEREVGEEVGEVDELMNALRTYLSREANRPLSETNYSGQYVASNALSLLKEVEEESDDYLDALIEGRRYAEELTLCEALVKEHCEWCMANSHRTCIQDDDMCSLYVIKEMREDG